MRIDVRGNPDGAPLLLLHPMFAGPSFFDGVAEVLGEDHMLIIPTLSGHYEGSTYDSAEAECRAIDRFLRAEGIGKLSAMAGFSLGGNIAFGYFCAHPERVDRLVVDSAPLFRFPGFVRRLFLRRYRSCAERAGEALDRGARDEAIALLDASFNGMGSAQVDNVRSASASGLASMVESCFDVALPALPPEQRSRITFVYGDRDPSALSRYRTRRYKGSACVRLKGHRHCGLLREDPLGYARRFLIPAS